MLLLQTGKGTVEFGFFLLKKTETPAPSTSSVVLNYGARSSHRESDTSDWDATSCTSTHADVSTASSSRDPWFGPDAAFQYIEE
ncbi:hypothetical protein Y1Q_0015292 [Alligator mississippiensis]|uniref:Uncharacterized protein n=1 Tax=Alligator mississippiensis TaxID=8496 RepID=A0A151P3W2_ALLMI|nr:hypothetical protein Y1Q_0015292 [Alligator mississippiensis]